MHTRLYTSLSPLAAPVCLMTLEEFRSIVLPTSVAVAQLNVNVSVVPKAGIVATESAASMVVFILIL